VLQRGLRMLDGRRSDRFTEYDGNLSSVEVPPLDHVVSPSRLERWTACPFAYLARYLLRVEPIDEPDDEISITALERGSLHHDALDLFHRAVIAGDLPQPTRDGWTDDHRAALRRCFTEVCARSERRGRTGRPAFWADEQRRMEADLLEWLDHDSETSRSRGITVVGSEHEFDAAGGVGLTLVGGRTLSIMGKIDRVDRAADGSLVVTDHKSGRNKYGDLSADDPTLGMSAFQLPSYAAAARAMAGEPDAVVRAEYGMFGKGKYARPGYVLTDDVWHRVGHAADLVVRGIEAGYFPNRPARPGFRMYVECWYCEPDGLGTAERWSEWERKRHDPAIAPWFAPDDDAGAEGRS
jgi:RecB family exonuclease